MDGIRSWTLLIMMLLKRSAVPIVTGATLLAIVLAFGIRFSSEYLALALLAMMLITVVNGRDMPHRARVQLFGSYFASIMSKWAVVVSLLLLIGYATKQSAYFSRFVLFSWFLITPIAIYIAQWVLHLILERVQNRPENRRSVIIAGVTPSSQRLAEYIETDRGLGMTLLGYFEDRTLDRNGPLDYGKLLGTLSEVVAFVKSRRVDAVYIALPIKQMKRTKVLLDELQDTTVSVYFVPDIFVFDLIQSRVDSIHDLPVLALLESPFYDYNGAIKRLYDLFVASVILTLISPIMLAIAVAIKCSSPGPAIFKQRRYGLAGEEIFVYKFRTMTVVEDGPHIEQAKKDDQRFTKVGAWLRKRSLDELPQFINVIQGRMSIVGPRPHAVAHNEIYRKVIKGYMIRHKVLPGITGWAQVNGCRGETPRIEQMQNRVHFDLEYLRNWSVWLDCKIILRTLGVVIGDDQAH